MNQKKHIHLIGICGTAMASLAGMLKQRGFHVTGSDAAAYPPMSDFLRELSIPLAQPFDAKNLEPAPDLVVVGNAMSRGNVELEHVLDQRIPFCSLPQLLHDEFLRGKEVLVVAGTHGKTTTTSMLAWIFHSAGLHPSFLIGGIAENFGSSFHLGAGEALHSRRRRIRHRFLRQGAEVSALLSRLDDSDLGRVRSRRHLQRSRRRRDRVQAPGESDSAPRTHRRLRRFRRRGRRKPKPGALSGEGVLPGRALRRRPARELESHEPAS